VSHRQLGNEEARESIFVLESEGWVEHHHGRLFRLPNLMVAIYL
jgi:hypothetical protein